MVTDLDYKEDLERSVGREGLWIIPENKNPSHEVAFKESGSVNPGFMYGSHKPLGRTLMALMWNHKEEAGIQDVEKSQLLAHHK